MTASAVEQLQQLRQELDELAHRKQLVEEQIMHIEQQIYTLEDTYLEDTLLTGNAIKGFDNYLGLRPMPNVEKRKLKVKDSDRLFSRTSATFEKSMGIVHAPEGGPSHTEEVQQEMPMRSHVEQHHHQQHHDDDDDDGSIKRKKKLKRFRDDDVDVS